MALLYFLVCFHIALLLPPGQALHYGRRGFDTTLDPIIPGPPEKILWRQGGRKVVKFDGSEERVYGTFQDRVVLDWITAALTIKDLQEDDGGPYELEATINKKMVYSQHELAVIDKVAVPTISCVVNGTLATLTCFTDGPPSLITYHWTLDHGVHGGPDLAIYLVGKQDETVYPCRATNPISQEMGIFVAKDCYPDNFPYTGMIIGVIVSVICLLLVSAVCVRCSKKWKKAHPKDKDISDVEKQPHCTSQGPDGMRRRNEDKERESLLYNKFISQPPDRWGTAEPAMRPPDSGSEKQEDDTTNSGLWCNSNLVSAPTSETKLLESHHHPTDLDSKCNAGDKCEFEEPSLQSESNLPPTASPIGCGLHPVVNEPNAMQTLETEPEKRQEAAVSGAPPSDESVSNRESHQDGNASHLSSASHEHPQSFALKTSDDTTNAGTGPSPALPETASDERSDSEIAPPRPQTLRGDHLGSDGGCDEAAHRDCHGSDLTAPEPAAVALREEDVAAMVPLSIVSSPEVVEEEEEEERIDTGEACISTRREAGDECLVAADDPQVNVEALPSEVKEKVVNDTKAPHDDTEVSEEGEVEEDDGKDGGVASLSKSEPDTDTSMEDEDALSTPEDKHENAKDGAGQIGFSAKPGMETPERKEKDDDVAEVQEEGEVEGDGVWTLERGVHPVVNEPNATQTLETEPEKRQEAALSGAPPSDESVSNRESHRDGEASCLSSASHKHLQGFALKTTDDTTNAGPSPALPETASDDHLGSDGGRKEVAHRDCLGSDPTTPEPAAVAPREEDVAALVPLSVVSSPEVVEEEEVKEEERIDTGEACVSTRREPGDKCLVAADDPQVNVEALPSEVKEEVVNDTKAPHDDAEVPEEGEVEEDDTDTSKEDENLLGTPEDKHENTKDGAGQVTFSDEPGTETPERKEKEEDDDVAETLHGDAELQEEGEVEEDGGREGEMTSLTEMHSGRDSDTETPGESEEGQEETQRTEGNHEETGEGPLSDHLDEEVERRGGNKDAETNAKKEAITE